MAVRAYKQGNFHWLNGDLSWASDNVKVALCTSGYSPLTGTGQDEFLSVIAGGNIVATSANLASKTNSGGALDAADLVFSSVTGATVTQFVMYNDTGSSATSQLMFLWDTATNLPVTPNGGNITIQWAEATNFITNLNFAGLSEREKVAGLWRRLFGRKWKQKPSGVIAPDDQVIIAPWPGLWTPEGAR